MTPFVRPRSTPEALVSSPDLLVSGLSGDRGGEGMQIQAARSPGFYAQITGQPDPTSNAYAFQRIDDLTFQPITGDAAIVGDGVEVAAFEMGQSLSVPVGVVVPLTPLRLAVGYGFTYTAGSSPPSAPLVAYCATVGPLPPCTYANNGPDTSGVGATLTANSPGALTTIDGPVVPQVGGNVLVWQQADTTQNGLYTLVSRGDATTPWQLVRTPGADTNPGICGLLVFVTAGTQIFQRLFVQQQPVNTADGSPQIRFGFDAITFGVVGPPLTAAQSSNVIISTAAPTGTYPTFTIPPGSTFSQYLVTFEWGMGLPSILSPLDPTKPCAWQIEATLTIVGGDNVGGVSTVGFWTLPAGITLPELSDTRSSTLVIKAGATVSVEANLITSSNFGGIDVNLYCSMSAVGIS